MSPSYTHGFRADCSMLCNLDQKLTKNSLICEWNTADSIQWKGFFEYSTSLCFSSSFVISSPAYSHSSSPILNGWVVTTPRPFPSRVFIWRIKHILNTWFCRHYLANLQSFLLQSLFSVYFPSFQTLFFCGKLKCMFLQPTCYNRTNTGQW